MKKGYWLIVAFTAWCLMCAIWYMFGVKGMSNDPTHFSPQPPLQAIVEILVMITSAFLMGFGLAWLMRDGTIRNLAQSLKNTEWVIAGMKNEITGARTDAEVWQKKWEQAEEKVGAVVNDNENRIRQYNDLLKQLEGSRSQHSELEALKAKLEGEVSSVRFRVKLLENDVSERDQSAMKLKAEIEELSKRPQVEHREWSDHPFVRPVPADEAQKDDLTLIKGIGPAFQRKLNSLDIFTFRQISELSGEAVERLAEVIEVFPERIHKDNWIGQATKLYAKQLE